MKTKANTYVNPGEIANLAKEIWEREGRQSGRDLDYWLQAERQLLSSRNRGNNLRLMPSRTCASKLPDSITHMVQIN
jgi:hypothetical protein